MRKHLYIAVWIQEYGYYLLLHTQPWNDRILCRPISFPLGAIFHPTYEHLYSQIIIIFLLLRRIAYLNFNSNIKGLAHTKNCHCLKSNCIRSWETALWSAKQSLQPEIIRPELLISYYPSQDTETKHSSACSSTSFTLMSREQSGVPINKMFKNFVIQRMALLSYMIKWNIKLIIHGNLW